MNTKRNVSKSLFLSAMLLTVATLYSSPAQAQWSTSTVRDASLSSKDEKEGGVGTFAAFFAQGEATSFWPTEGHQQITSEAHVVTYQKTTFTWTGGGTTPASFNATGQAELRGEVTGVTTQSGQVWEGYAQSNSNVSGITSGTSGGVNEGRSAPNGTSLTYNAVVNSNWTFAVPAGENLKVVSTQIEGHATAYQIMSRTKPGTTEPDPLTAYGYGGFILTL